MTDLDDTLPGLPVSRPTGVGLCLSGGGYRAMLFHLGTLWRLNDAGYLPKLTRISSVSGGSITAGLLGCTWKNLEFGHTGVAIDFLEHVVEPILAMGRYTLDVPAVLKGLLFGGVAHEVEGVYDRMLYHGATLQSLPDDNSGPRFIIMATDLSNGVGWRFSRPYMRDYKTASYPNPILPLAQAVAASSAFPPFLSPVVLNLVDGKHATLTDGGVYDNLGIEPVLKNCGTIFVSDAGGPFKEEPRPHRGWILGTYRVLLTLQAEVGWLRKRQVMAALKSTTNELKGAFWAVTTDPTDFPAFASTLPVPVTAAKRLGDTPTRLKALPDETLYGLVNWGYAAADAGLRSYVDPHLPEPPGFPLPGGVGL